VAGARAGGGGRQLDGGGAAGVARG